MLLKKKKKTKVKKKVTKKVTKKTKVKKINKDSRELIIKTKPQWVKSSLATKIKYKDKNIFFAADLLPSTGHIPLAYVMGYDTQPLKTLDEKGRFLKEVADNKDVIFLQHDNYNECCTVKHSDKGIILDETFNLLDIL